jgi:hypothetical protein
MLTIWEAANHPCWLENGGANRRSYPSTPMMAAVVGAMQVEIGLRHLLSDDRMNRLPAYTLEIALDPPQRLERFSITIAASCPFHLSGGVRFPAPGPPSSTTVRRLLASSTTGAAGGGRATVVLDWPICTSARCTHCGHRWSPMTRLASLRTSGVCPACGSCHFIEEEVLRGIEAGSRWADRTLQEIGLPEGHLHMIQRDLER